MGSDLGNDNSLFRRWSGVLEGGLESKTAAEEGREAGYAPGARKWKFSVSVPSP
jgi:hypothetical protein